MRKKRSVSYGQPLLLYPGMALRVGSMMQIAMPLKNQKKETVDNFVDKEPSTGTFSKIKPSRQDCSKNRH